jgi:hypothetical protein
MSLGHGSSPVRNGLVFHMDMDNSGKCYKGPNIENKWTRMASNSYNGNGIVADRSEERIVIPEIGRTKVLTSDFYNNYPDVSSNCCPNLFRFSENNSTHRTTVSPSTQYTYGIVYRVESGYTNANFMYRYEYDSSLTKTTEGGVHNTTKRKHLGNGWYWAWNTFTTQATTTSIGFAGFFYYRYSDVPDKVQLAKVWLTEGDYTQVHPKFWPDVATTRGSSESIKDLTSKQNLEVSNISFTEDGFEFDGTDDKLVSQNNCGLTSSITLEACFKSTSSGGIHRTLICTDTGYQYGAKLMNFKNNNRWGIWLGFGTSNYEAFYSEDINDSNVHVLTASWNQSTGQVRLYKDGEWVTNVSTGQTSDIVLNNGKITIGTEYHGGTHFTGEIYDTKIYNRVLSDDEVKQNFEALRGRFGI